MEPTNPFARDDNKAAAIVSYFFIVGWLIAYFGLYINNKTSLASYHLRQTLLFHIIAMILKFAVAAAIGLIWLSTGMFSPHSLMSLIYLGLFIIWLIGLIAAINGEKKPIPFIGESAQGMFSSI